ncbi:uncharacterized protein PRCAT00001523001 [Priceomyces carsonii]|uniref:uncharacterized protein n=1 Tax=Priceomyces carsonii TaxID=28549 RepID=UPI002ED8E9A5|nr:unnamed protein product [Priceomyces carsonii]
MNEQGETERLLFDDLIPLQFRILFLIQLGALLWYVTIHFCSKYYKINVLHLLGLSYSPNNLHLDREYPNTGEHHSVVPAELKENQTLLAGVWNNFIRISVVNIISFIISKIIESCIDLHKRENSITVRLLFNMIPFCALLFNLHELFFKSRHAIGLNRAYTTVKRIMMGKINHAYLRTNDILISDTLTSYSKVLNDLLLCIWNVFYGFNSPYDIRFEALILCIPTLIRMKQCWIEYSRTKYLQHCLNLLKYTTALGPIIINMLLKQKLATFKHDNPEKVDQDYILNALSKLNTWWYVCSVINSSYSFIWDVKMDWGFQAFDIFEKHTTTFTLLRPGHQLVYRNNWIYYPIILIDFLLRYIWILKLFIVREFEHTTPTYLSSISTFLFGYDAFSFGYALIELLEILRRWLWCILKLEADFIKLQRAHSIEDISLVQLNR